MKNNSIDTKKVIMSLLSEIENQWNFQYAECQFERNIKRSKKISSNLKKIRELKNILESES